MNANQKFDTLRRLHAHDDAIFQQIREANHGPKEEEVMILVFVEYANRLMEELCPSFNGSEKSEILHAYLVGVFAAWNEYQARVANFTEGNP